MFFITIEIMAKKKSKVPSNVIAINKRAKFEYSFLEDFEAGISLLGWEVKSLRESKISFNEAYVFIKNFEVFLNGVHISPLTSASTHICAEPARIRKLLLNKKEISTMVGSVEKKGLTIIPTKIYWKSGKVKLAISIAKGKNIHDKRQAEKTRDWNIDKQRLLKINR